MKLVKYSFIVKIYHFNHFLSVQFTGIKHTHIVGQPSPLYSSLELFHHPKLKSLYPLNKNSHFSLSQATSNHHSIFLYEFDYNRYLISGIIHYPFLSCLFHLTYIVFSNFIHVVTCVRISLIFKAE